MMAPKDLKELLCTAIQASLAAGEEIIDVYHSDFEVELKEDNSPLTQADKRSNTKIEELLVETNIPILSEEGEKVAYEKRKNWEHLWVVDPLDGTREFVKRNDEFTVNIALVQDQKPILGVIYAPVKCVLYFSAKGLGAYKTECAEIKPFRSGNVDVDALISKSARLPRAFDHTAYKVVASRSHMSEETLQFIEDLAGDYDDIETVSAGSAIKLCLVAEGAADAYPRFAPTMEWDTAAGHAIANEAGKTLIDYDTKAEMVYNRENLVNSWFVVE